MHIEVYATHNEVSEANVKGKTVIIIDVLRATSVIITALSNGAKKVRTTTSQGEALEQKAKDPNLLIGGERHAEKIKGFDFGNSPLEYTQDKVLNKSIILSTTNGTQAVLKAQGSSICIAASFINLNAIVTYLEKQENDLAIICSGTDGAFSLDDGLCAGLILHKLNKRKSVRTNDFGRLNAIPFDKPDFSIPNLLSTSFHLNRLKEKGYTPDIEYCLQLNSVPIIPIWDGDGFSELKE